MLSSPTLVSDEIDPLKIRLSETDIEEVGLNAGSWSLSPQPMILYAFATNNVGKRRNHSK